jgi:hypothetical protein
MRRRSISTADMRGRGMHGRVMKSAESKPLMGTGTSFFLEGSFCIFYHKLIFYFHYYNLVTFSICNKI